jgi:hypothetical protein
MKYILTRCLNAIYFQLLCFFLWLQIECSYEKNRDFASDQVLMLNIINILKKLATARVIAVFTNNLMQGH